MNKANDLIEKSMFDIKGNYILLTEAEKLHGNIVTVVVMSVGA
jgi:hypothetical protein